LALAFGFGGPLGFGPGGFPSGGGGFGVEGPGRQLPSVAASAPAAGGTVPLRQATAGGGGGASEEARRMSARVVSMFVEGLSDAARKDVESRLMSLSFLPVFTITQYCRCFSAFAAGPA
jgi:hypothetical protein